MLAVHLSRRRVSVRTVPRPRRAGGFSLIRLLMAGICNTDLELQRGYYGFVGTPGHEFVGEVIASGNRALVGRRVVGEINVACRACDWCRRGLERHCPRRRVLGIVDYPGAFRDYLTLPDANLHVLPDSISTERGVFVEPLAAACEILEQVSIPSSATVAVLGDGKLGLLVSQVLRAHGCGVHQFGRHAAKLRIASKAGVETRVAGKALPKREYEWVVDATGSSDGLGQAVSMARPRGTVFMKSTVHRPVALDTAPVIVNEVTLVGSRCGRFQPAIDLLERGRVDVDDMISGVVPLPEAPRAFRRASEPGVLKVLLAPSRPAARRA